MDIENVLKTFKATPHTHCILLRTGRILRQKYVYVAWFGLHFLLIISFSLRDTLWLVAHGPTIFPASFRSYSHKAETVVSALLGQRLAASNPVRQVLATYLHIAGIETGYSYFAPNVPGSYKLVFELHYPDGRIEYELPRVNSTAAGLRVAGLLDKIGRTPYDAFARNSRQNAGSIDLARASRGEDNSRHVWISQAPELKRIRAR